MNPRTIETLRLALVGFIAWSGIAANAQAQAHRHDEDAAHGEAREEHADLDDHDHDDEDHDDHDDETGPVQVSAAVLKEFDIALDTVGSGVLREEVVLPGEIKFNREAVAYATPRFQGTVQAIRARLADRVKQGQVLATLQSTETLRPFEVTAPFDGTVVAYEVTPGQTVAAGLALFTIADLSTVWADLRIYQRNLAQVHEGQKVIIRGGHDLAVFEGTIAYIAPTIDEHTRTGLARVVVDNGDRRWKPGQFIRGTVSIEEHPVDLAVPRSAVITLDEDPVVFVQTPEGFEPRPVRLGHSDSQSFEVLGGLEAGQTIVVRNPISLKAEMGKGAFGDHGHAH